MGSTLSKKLLVLQIHLIFRIYPHSIGSCLMDDGAMPICGRQNAITHLNESLFVNVASCHPIKKIDHKKVIIYLSLYGIGGRPVASYISNAITCNECNVLSSPFT